MEPIGKKAWTPTACRIAGCKTEAEFTCPNTLPSHIRKVYDITDSNEVFELTSHGYKERGQAESKEKGRDESEGSLEE